MNLGYCCINLSINQNKRPKDYIKVNRGMTLATFKTKGLKYVAELALLNLTDLKKIIQWNIENNIRVYRLSSDMFPWFTHYKLEELPNFNILRDLLAEIGQLALSNNIRLSAHPGPYCVLSSENPNVVINTIDELNKHAQIMDLLGLPQTRFYPINIHINTTKPTREAAAARFVENYKLLLTSCKARLVLENDDKHSQYSIKILYDLIWKQIGISLTFDQHHFLYGPQDQTMEEAIKLAHSTWTVKPLFHMSSSAKLTESKDMMPTAHADYIWEKIETAGLDFDVEIEAKMKDLAVLDYIKKFQ